MSRNSIIEQLRANGAIAAHPLNKWVTIVKGKPQKMTLANPLFMDKKVLKNGDKIAIVDTSDYSTAFICRIANFESSGTSKTQVMDLALVKTIELDG
jgi:ABC-type antimicrobial peptide transport system ATPase subunit